MRVLTGLPGEPPDEPLVRVVTGPLPAAELPDPAWEPLLRVVTGTLPAAEPLDPAWEPLVRVVTGALPAAELPDPMCEPLERVAGAPGEPLLDPARCEPLAPVLAEAPACEPRGPVGEPGERAPDSWWITWIVRRITWVRTSTAGLRAASVAVV
jgi:hypothetical protein